MKIIATVFSFIGRFFNGLADRFKRPDSEEPVKLVPYFDSMLSLPEELDDDFIEEADREARRVLDETESLERDEEGELDERGLPELLFDKVGRTVERGNCNIQAFFGLVPIDNHGADRPELRFSELQPEIILTNNGSLGITIRITSVGDFPGTLNITVIRDAPGTMNPPPVNISAKNMADINKAAGKKGSRINIPSPPGMDARKPVVVETIIASVSWDPDDGDPCSITPPEKLRVTWNFVNPLSQFIFVRPGMIVEDRLKSSVNVGRSLIEEVFPDGRRQFTVPVQSFFVVEKANVCCDQPGEYAVIQFVRHRFNVRQPSREGEDTWTLDILDTEGKLARAKMPYDPTFTHNPRGDAPPPPPQPLVYPGPNGAGLLAINQIDRPGISDELYNRLAQFGGKFVFHFLSLLVCKLTPSLASKYLAEGQVSQILTYEIELNFVGDGKAPTVSGNLLSIEDYFKKEKKKKKCFSLSEFIKRYDNKNGMGITGKLADGYNNPRNHEVGIPK